MASSKASVRMGPIPQLPQETSRKVPGSLNQTRRKGERDEKPAEGRKEEEERDRQEDLRDMRLLFPQLSWEPASQAQLSGAKAGSASFLGAWLPS